MGKRNACRWEVVSIFREGGGCIINVAIEKDRTEGSELSEYLRERALQQSALYLPKLFSRSVPVLRMVSLKVWSQEEQHWHQLSAF